MQPRFLARVTLLTLVVLVASLFMLQTFGGNTWDKLATTIVETLRLSRTSRLDKSIFPDTLNPRLEAFYRELQKLAIPTVYTPTWLPDHFEQAGTITTERDPYPRATATFSNQEDTLTFDFAYIIGSETVYEQEDAYDGSWKINGVTYYYLSSPTQNRVFWSIRQFQSTASFEEVKHLSSSEQMQYAVPVSQFLASIEGAVDLEELKEIVRSIYARV